MKWTKKGLIFNETDGIRLGVSNTQVPYAIRMDNCIRIFFGARSKNGSAADIYSIDVDLVEPKNILTVRSEPVLGRGSVGTFDQDGTLPVCVKRINNDYYLYYGGFSKSVSHPHVCMMGLAISKDEGLTFNRISEGPIIPISIVDPYLIGSADVMYNNGLWHMIYTSGTKWVNINNSLEISYTLKYSSSSDGIKWDPTGQIVIPQEIESDAFAKPAIFRINNMFAMYFSKRHIINYRKKGGSAYSLGFATSADMITWNRYDSQAGIDTSEDGWDSEMICYPSIIEVDGRYLMFYNGNGFGKSGFGYAELDVIN